MDISEKNCSACKVKKSLNEFNRNKLRHDGHHTVCKACRSEYRSNHPEQRTREKITRKSSPSNRFYRCKAGAESRGYEFKLTPQQFRHLIREPCSYGVHRSERVGLDRVNNDFGYLYENVVPCCRTCNIAKGSLKPKDFIEHFNIPHNQLSDRLKQILKFNDEYENYWDDKIKSEGES